MILKQFSCTCVTTCMYVSVPWNLTSIACNYIVYYTVCIIQMSVDGRNFSSIIRARVWGIGEQTISFWEESPKFQGNRQFCGTEYWIQAAF